MKTERGLALQDLLTGAYDYIESLELKPHARIYLVEHLATTEYVHSPISIHFTKQHDLLQTSALHGRQRKDSAHSPARRVQERRRALRKVVFAKCEVYACYRDTATVHQIYKYKKRF